MLVKRNLLQSINKKYYSTLSKTCDYFYQKEIIKLLPIKVFT